MPKATEVKETRSQKARCNRIKNWRRRQKAVVLQIRSQQIACSKRLKKCQS
jgi:hypothetical protein